VDVQYGFAAILILGGALTIWIGPDVAGENPDGSNAPVPEKDRWMVRAFGAGCVACGVFLLVMTALGFRGPPAEGPPIP
jgi:hypothetical protein